MSLADFQAAIDALPEGNDQRTLWKQVWPIVEAGLKKRHNLRELVKIAMQRVPIEEKHFEACYAAMKRRRNEEARKKR